MTRRFPGLKFQFLECGAGWACTLYAELVHRWQKRNKQAIAKLVDDAEASAPEFLRLLETRGDARIKRKLQDLPHGIMLQLGQKNAPDDWAACGIESTADIEELFVKRFYFGCEADDPSAVWAYDPRTNPGGVRLRAVLGSDMGHWDVPDAAGILPEAWELVEDGVFSVEDFRRFTFEYPLEFFAGVNPTSSRAPMSNPTCWRKCHERTDDDRYAALPAMVGRRRRGGAGRAAVRPGRRDDRREAAPCAA